jgi:YtkA-like
VEAALTIGILCVVAALTSLNTPRNDLLQRAALAALTPFSATQSANDLQIQLTVAPGGVGQNTFTLSLQDTQGNPIADASLIRLRFDDRTQNVGESELRITQAENGSYSVSGANLSLPGRWRIRTMIQRPDHYDSVVDFMIPVQAAAPPPSVDPDAPLPNHIPALLIAGVLALGVGGFFIAQSRFPGGAALLSCGLLMMGGVFLFSAAGDVTSGEDTIAAGTQADAMATAVANCASDLSGALQITSPADGATVSANPLVLQITNNTKGIARTYVDGNLTSRSRGTLIALTGLSPGKHDICVVAGESAWTGTQAKAGIQLIVEAPSEGQ